VVLALLAGWQAALVHPLEHVDTLGGFVHLGDGEPNPDKSLLCDALSALTACAAVAGLAFTAIAPAEPRLVPLRLEARQAEPPPFFSQAPPTSL
jgi:hypothetical protein